jgi:hypothetical protein
MRILLRLADPPLETTLLRAGHEVRTLPPGGGALAGLAAWSTRRVVLAFAPDRIVAAADDAEAARLAERLDAQLLPMPGDTPFLADPFLPPPFRVEAIPPVIARFQPTRLDPAFAPLPPDGRFLIPPDVAILDSLPAAVLPHWMAAGCAIVARDSEEARQYLGAEAALLHPQGTDPAPLALDLARDPGARRRLAAASRSAFETRHAAARAAALSLGM